MLFGTADMASLLSEATVGTIITPITRPAASTLNDPVGRCSQSRSTDGLHEREREQTVDDGRDAGQDLQDRLQDGAQPGSGILRQQDRRAEPERDGGDQGNCGRPKVAVTSGMTPNDASANRGASTLSRTRSR